MPLRVPRWPVRLLYAIGFDPQFQNSLIEKYGLSKVRRAMAGPD